MVNFPQMNSNIPSKPVYRVVISQLDIWEFLLYCLELLENLNYEFLLH